MRGRRSLNRLLLGPVVGYTDEQSTRIWIRAGDDPGTVPYQLRIGAVGTFPFASTEAFYEFGTATADAVGLHSDRRYRYQVLRRGRVVRGATGSFRTMPDPLSMGEFAFVTISCSHQEKLGAWGDLVDYVEESQPRFVVMMGDQVYLDQTGDLWAEHVRSRRTENRRAQRRAAMAEKYQQAWSRSDVQHIMANVPCLMVWDDHEIRDGWGSWASDSPTLRDRYPKGADIFDHYNNFFEDARDVYWHFQAVHNPPPTVDMLQRPLPTTAADPVVLPASGQRMAMPFVFRCGRLGVIVVDSRGERDLWRSTDPVLGSNQWAFVDDVVDRLPADVDALVVVTPGPIVTMAPDGITQRLLGGREDDVEFFKQGDAGAMRDIQDGELNEQDNDTRLLAAAAVGGLTGLGAAAGYNAVREFKVGSIDDVRDQWSNRLSRQEQERLIRRAVAARTSNRIGGIARALLFAGDDIHAGALFTLSIDGDIEVPCLISSGISQETGETLLVGTLVDEDFEVADGIRASLHDIINEANFGLVHIVPTGSTPLVLPAVAHAGNSFALGIHLGLGALNLGQHLR